jgi:uncharacterized protein (TIGR03437 family)
MCPSRIAILIDLRAARLIDHLFQVVNNPPASGASAGPGETSLVSPTVTVGSVTTTVVFSGLSEGSVGLFQINFTLPATLPAGAGAPPALPLVVRLPSNASPPVNLYVSK